jgi:hypothetical protein
MLRTTTLTNQTDRFYKIIKNPRRGTQMLVHFIPAQGYYCRRRTEPLISPPALVELPFWLSLSAPSAKRPAIAAFPGRVRSLLRALRALPIVRTTMS